MANLQRFVDAQAGGIYETALREIRAGEKRSHWMWFVFPQIAGLGRSETAQFYAIEDVGEAARYLAHPVLGERLVECTGAMSAWAGRRSAEAVLGAVDARKFISSMTLFESAAAEPGPFASALDGLCAGMRDQATLARA